MIRSGDLEPLKQHVGVHAKQPLQSSPDSHKGFLPKRHNRTTAARRLPVFHLMEVHPRLPRGLLRGCRRLADVCDAVHRVQVSAVLFEGAPRLGPETNGKKKKESNKLLRLSSRLFEAGQSQLSLYPFTWVSFIRKNEKGPGQKPLQQGRPSGSAKRLQSGRSGRGAEKRWPGALRMG